MRVALLALLLAASPAFAQDDPHPWLLVRNQADHQRRVIGPLLAKMGIQNKEAFEARKAKINAVEITPGGKPKTPVTISEKK